MPASIPERLLDAYSDRYPRAWLQAERFRKARAELGDWPDWCYMPMAGAYAIVSGGGSRRVPPDRMMDISAVAALAAWRPTRVLAEIDRAILASLIEQPQPDIIEAADLTALPVWCLWVDLTVSPSLAGAFLHLEHDAQDGHAEFRALLVRDDLSHYPALLDLGGAPTDGARSVLTEALRAADQHGWHLPIELGTTEALAEHVRPFLQLALYLASDVAEWHPHLPKLVQRRKQKRFFVS